MGDPDLLASLVDQLAQLLRAIDDVLLFGVLGLDLFSNLGVFPRRSHVELLPPLKLSLTLNGRVEDPFPIGERKVRSHGMGSLVESMNLLLSKLPVQDFKVVARLDKGVLE